jgi:hypothetical protein
LSVAPCVARSGAVYSSSDPSGAFFKLLRLLVTSEGLGSDAEGGDVMISSLIRALLRHPVLELTADDRDTVLRGLLQVTAALLSAFAS